MQRLSRLMTGATLVIAATFAASAMAAGPPHGGPGGHGGPSGHFSMPPHGYRGSPPNFQGRLPQGGRAPNMPRYELGRRGHDLGRFNGRGFSSFSSQDRNQWRGGGWRHETHNGHLGWWWVLGDLWYYYPAPIYPYPSYVGPDYYYDYYGAYPAPSNYWYYCEDPMGYYPDVMQCNMDWEPVPPQN